MSWVSTEGANSEYKRPSTCDCKNVRTARNTITAHASRPIPTHPFPPLRPSVPSVTASVYRLMVS